MKKTKTKETKSNEVNENQQEEKNIIDNIKIEGYELKLAIPTMLGASALKLVKSGFAFTGFEWGVLGFGTLVSFVVSVFVIKFLMDYIKKHDFKVFGWYRIVLGCIVLGYFFIS